MASCKRALDHAQILDQLLGIGISRAGAADILPLDAGDGGVELAQHDREKLPVGLAGIAGLDLLSLAAALKRTLKLGLETRRHGKCALGDGEGLGQLDDPLAIMPQRGERVLPQRPGGDFGRHPRIAVAVTADPGAILQEGRQLEALAGVILLERGVDQAQHLRRLLEQGLVEEMQAPRDLVLHGRLLQMQLARHPHQLDLVAQVVDEGGALAFGPARHLELTQQEIDLAIFLQHGDALGLGRMRGDHRPDAQVRQERLDLLRRDPGIGRLGEDMGEGATQRIAAPGALDLTTAAHRGVLIGDGEKLEPDALRLERAGHQLRGEADDIGAAKQHGFDLGLMPPHHLKQKLEQEIGRLLGRGAADHGLRRRGLKAGGFQLLVHGDARHSRPLRSACMGSAKRASASPPSFLIARVPEAHAINGVASTPRATR